ncbi:MAG: RusA family crossover junction endodeoxyribonuclease [Desulfovibrio sp.]
MKSSNTNSSTFPKQTPPSIELFNNNSIGGVGGSGIREDKNNRQQGFVLTLPYPPSVNRIWRAVNGRNILSKHGRLYRLAVKSVVVKARAQEEIPKGPIKGGLVCVLEVYPPDNRRRDLDNVSKAILDGLTHAKVWLDDSQVSDMRIVRSETVKNGKVVVRVERTETTTRTRAREG